MPSVQSSADTDAASVPRWARIAATVLATTVAVLLASGLAVVMGLS